MLKITLTFTDKDLKAFRPNDTIKAPSCCNECPLYDYDYGFCNGAFALKIGNADRKPDNCPAQFEFIAE